MTAAKNVYALMLALVIVLSGCFGAGTDDSDAQDASDSSDTNEAPQVYWILDVWDRTITTYNQTTGEEITTKYHNFTWTVSAIDFDGNITDVGLDTNLDGAIDFAFTTDGDWSDYSVHIGPTDLVMENDAEWGGQVPGHAGYCIYRVNLIAFDDGGGTFVEPVSYVFGGDVHSENHCPV